jgi:crotonobetainyl-CoA:carnitine CoA-transferase CaiB-like acyl-CoA transferase
MNVALKGVRVLDCTHIIAGPYCSRLLGELGADVIKIEPPKGELSRGYKPFIDGQSLYYMNFNVGKKSITLNLKHEKGKRILKELIKKSDVFVENYRPGTMDRLGVGYEEQKKINPRIIYVSITGFGSYGPYKDYPAFDHIIQAMVGLMDVTGYPDSPVRAGPPITDIGSGIFAALATISALYWREKTGKGQKIDIALYDVGITFLMEHIVYSFGSIPLRVGNRFQLSAPSNVYKAKDGDVYIIVPTDELWNRFLTIANREDFVDDPRFKTSYDRAINVDIVDKIVSEWVKSKSVKEVIEILTEEGIICQEVRPLKSIFSDPHVKARQMLINLDDGVPIVGSPLKLEKTPGRVKGEAPTLGQHNYEIYHDLLGFSDEEIRKLKEEGII